jgi:hypothetical protein
VKLALVLTLTSAALFAADPALMNLVPSDSKMVAGIHVDRTTSSPFGQFLMHQMQQNDADFQKFVTTTGFDPRRDLREVVSAATDTASKGHGLVLARGTFDTVRIGQALKANGASFTNYKDVQIITGNGTSSGWIAFLDGQTAVVGDPDAVKAAIDRRAGGLPLDATLSAKVQDVSNRYDAWAVTSAPLSNFAGKVPDKQLNGALNGDMLQGIALASGGVQFGSTVQIGAEAVTRSAQDATSLVDVVKFLAGMVQMNRDKPEVSNFAALLDTLSFKTAGNIMSMTLSMAEPDLEKLIKPATAVHSPRTTKKVLHEKN